MRESLAAWGTGARLSAPVGFRCKAPGGVQGAKPPKALVFFNAETAFLMQT